MNKTAIIVPCYNESSRLQQGKFTDYAAGNSEVCFIFINDGSTDRTRETLECLCRLAPRQMQCIHLENNGGKANAVRKGVLTALEQDFDPIGYWDADLSTPLNAIDRLGNVLNDPNVTVVMGSRVKLLGRKIQRRFFRHYFGRVFATLASLILNIPVYDTQCGAKLFRNTPELAMAFSQPFSVKWAFDVELLARLKVIKEKTGASPVDATIVEYPLEEWTHVSGSKIKVRDGFLIFLELFGLCLLLYAPGISTRYKKKLVHLQ